VRLKTVNVQKTYLQKPAGLLHHRDQSIQLDGAWCQATTAHPVTDDVQSLLARIDVPLI